MKPGVRATLAMVLLVVGVAQARLTRDRPVLLRLQGHVGATSEGDRRIAELTMRRGETVLTFQLNEIWVLSGDVASHDILSEVEGYTPSMSLSGPRDVVAKLEGAPADRLLDVTGFFRRGQRMLMLSAVEPAKTKR